jgi:predicted nicotinamide N-methyase
LRREILRARLSLATPALLPELRLYRAGPASRLSRLVSGAGAPYWAYAWAGGLALARYLLDHPETVAEKRVLDLGAGGGLVAIAAMKAGARQATAIDVDPDAIDAIALNAEANAVSVAALCGDPLDGPPPDVDLVLVGDLFYEAGLAARATAFLDRCRPAGIGALIGDPGRAPLPRARLERLAEYRLADFGDAPDAAATASAVFAFV